MRPWCPIAVVTAVMTVPTACRHDATSQLAAAPGPRSGHALETTASTGVPEAIPGHGERASPSTRATLPAAAAATTNDQTAGPRYSFGELGTLGGATSVAYDVNNLGIVVGCADTRSAGEAHAFLWQGGVMQDLGALPGDMRSEALAINDVQQITGCSYAAGGSSRGFFFQAGVMQDLGSLGGSTWGRGLNQVGQVVGEFEVREDHRLYVELVPHAFTWQAGTLTDLAQSFKDPSTSACAINDSDQIVGYSNCRCEATPGPRAYLWQAGLVTYLGSFGGRSSRAWAVNSVGQIVGEAEVLATVQGRPLYTMTAFLWQNGQMIQLDTLARGEACARDINEVGQIVGWSEMADGSLHAVIWDQGRLHDLNYAIPANSGAILRKAHGVSDSGQIVGECELQRVRRAFLLTPVEVAASR